MEIRSSHPSPVPERHAPITSSGLREAGASFGPVVEDVLVLTQYLGAGQIYKMEDAKLQQEFDAKPPLAAEPTVRLDRPFMMVPGWTTERVRFAPLVDKLTQGGINGGRVYYVKDGQFFADFEATQVLAQGSIPADARVFETLLKDPHAPPPVVADEIERNLQAIQRATGAAKVDVDAYSMGGLGTRVYLDRGGQAVGRLMMLGTPNNGTRFAELANYIIRRDIQFAMGMAGITMADLPALQWMTVDDRKGVLNPNLHALNARWPQQKANVEDVHIVGGQGQLTPASDGWRLFTAGDGLVPVESLSLPGTPARLVEGEKHHGFLNNDAEVYREMVRFFGWTPISAGP